MAPGGRRARLLGYALGDTGPKHAADGPFAILGLVSLASALATGATGARAMHDADGIALKAIYTRQIGRSASFQLAGVAAAAIAIVLVFR